MSKKLSVFFLHNVVSPYRLPVFEEINKSVDLDVNFCIARTSDRKWNIDLRGYSFKYRILKSWRIGPFIVNPNLLSALLQTSHDVYLVGDFPETAVSTFITVLVAKMRRKPVVLWSETIDNRVIYYQNLAISPKTSHRWLLAMLTGIITTYRKLLLGAPTTVAALSRNAYDFLLSQNVPASKIISGIQVYPSELLAASDTPKSDSPYAGRTVLLYLGYLNTLKGIDDLIAAVKQISDTNIRLLIVGDGPQKQQLHDLASEDSRIQFIGYTEGTAKANLMSWADLFILPTLADCWGMVVNESLYYGAPVIVTTAAGSAEIIVNDVNGKTIAPGDPQALAAVICALTKDKRSLDALKNGAAKTTSNITDSRVGAKPLIEAIIRAGAVS